MKKKYFAPTITIVEVELPAILAGSESPADEWGDSLDLKFSSDEGEGKE